MGLGIPTNVRMVRPELSDPESIMEAVKEGFTTKSVANNTGMGLDQLLRSVVLGLGGSVTIYSGKGIVKFSLSEGGIIPRCLPDVGFCPGTTIEVKIDPRLVPDRPDSEEDLLW